MGNKLWWALLGRQRSPHQSHPVTASYSCPPLPRGGAWWAEEVPVGHAHDPQQGGLRGWGGQLLLALGGAVRGGERGSTLRLGDLPGKLMR